MRMWEEINKHKQSKLTSSIGGNRNIWPILIKLIIIRFLWQICSTLYHRLFNFIHFFQLLQSFIVKCIDSKILFSQKLILFLQQISLFFIVTLHFHWQILTTIQSVLISFIHWVLFQLLFVLVLQLSFLFRNFL